MTDRTALLAVALAAALGSLPASDARAQSSDAATLRSQGNQAMLDMHYRDALAAYEQAHAAAPDDATLLYSISRAHELLGEYPEALAALQQFWKQSSPDAKARVGKLDELIKALRARVSTLTVKCNLAGARVLVRDKVVGTTPLPPLSLAAGTATIQVELDGFFPDRRDVVLPGDGALVLDVVMQKRSTSGLVDITTEPLGARVFVDGTLSGTSSPKLELVLPAGPHRIRAERDGYDEATVPFVLDPGASRGLKIELDRSVPLTSKWWFWTTVGVVVASGAFVTYALLTEKHADKGTLAPGQVAAPLVRF